MKKLLGIVVLGLLLSGNAFAKEIILNCENYRVIGYYKSGGITDEPGDSRLNEIFKINSKKNRIYRYNNSAKKFLEIRNAKWSDSSISWSTDIGTSKAFKELNRYDLSYTNNRIYINSPDWKKIEDFAKCKVSKKKF